tara:strand:+ start:8889 stop:9989 length:1101 start_codon:yes stop_codon:yes gene_type:complete
LENQIELYKIAAAYLHGFKKSKLKILLKRTGGLNLIFEETYSNLHVQTGLAISTLQKMKREKALKSARHNIEFNKSHRIRSLFLNDNAYPYQLKDCKDGPIQLNIIGDISFENKKIISVVGTRKCSPSSKQIVDQLIASLKGLDIIVVSGLASGIDTLVHEYCLKYEVPTIAVLGHGLNMIYPKENRSLAKEIIDSRGALISEFHFEQRPNKYSFPQRNRIIAGIADVTIVVESPIKGGSMITAELANSYSREVMAFPNSIDKNRLGGCNQLIKTNAAHMITSPEDLFDLMNWEIKTEEQNCSEPTILSQEEEGIIKTIKKHNEIHIDKIFESSNLQPSVIQALLMQLELKNYIFNPSGLFYSSRI